MRRVERIRKAVYLAICAKLFADDNMAATMALWRRLRPVGSWRRCRRQSLRADLVMQCRDVQLGGSREVACLTDCVNSGHFVGPRCRAALQITGRLC